jgi:hypothetical protein
MRRSKIMSIHNGSRAAIRQIQNECSGTAIKDATLNFCSSNRKLSWGKHNILFLVILHAFNMVPGACF